MFGSMKVFASVVALLVMALGWQTFQANRFEEGLDRERIARAEDRVGWDAALTAATGALVTSEKTAARLRSDLQLERRVVADARADVVRLQSETDAQLSELMEVTDVAPPEYQACMAVPLPADVQRLLVYDPGTPAEGGHDDESGAGSAAAGAHGRLPDPASGLRHAHARGAGGAGPASSSGGDGVQRAARASA